MGLLVPAAALNFFVAGMLGLLAATLVLAGRRRSESLLLAAFLFVVGMNFLFVGWAIETASSTAYRIGLLAMAVDPLLLLGFVTAYPFRQRTRLANALLVATGVLAALSSATLVLDMEAIHWASTIEDRHAPTFLLLFAPLALAYPASWAYAVRAVRRAPTPQLSRRAAWLLAALGVTVVPRIGLLHQDVALFRIDLLGPGSTVADQVRLALADTTVYLLLTGLSIALAVHALRGRLDHRPVRRALVWTVVATGFYGLARLTAGLWVFTGGPVIALNAAYALRWIPFGAILVHGLLAMEVVELKGARTRTLSHMGAAAAGLGAALLVLAFLGGPQGPPTNQAVALATAVGLGATAPAASATRRLCQRFAFTEGAARARARRLELYQALVEAAWASGPPPPAQRQALERERRAFGVTLEEARTLEHVVARRLEQPTTRALSPGDEPVPGLLIEGSLGAGGQGEVFAARAYPEGRRVAVKVLHDPGGDAVHLRQRLLRELAPLRALDHPNIVTLRDVHLRKGDFLLVLDHVEGLTLAKHLERNGPLDALTATRVARQVLSALDAAHENGILHLDLSPSNLLLSTDGRVCVADFGLARLQEPPSEDSRDRTRTMTTRPWEGTVPYIAPEQVRDDAVGPWTDLYQVAMVLYEALAGRPLVDVDRLDALEALEALAAPPLDLDPVPPPWRPVLERALAPRPVDRYPSARAFREAIIEGVVDPPERSG